MQAIIHAADIQHRDGGLLLMGSRFGLFPFLLKLYADSGYQGSKFQQGLRVACKQVNLEIVKRSDIGKFVVLPKRWIVERSIAWLNRCRRLAKDWECLNRNALGFLRWASIRHQPGGRLCVPDNITLVHLPPYSPELNPMENVREYLRANKLCRQCPEFEVSHSVMPFGSGHYLCFQWPAYPFRWPLDAANFTGRTLAGAPL